MVYRTAPVSMTLNDPYPRFKVTPFFDAEYLRNGTRYRQFQWNTNKDLRPTMTRSVARSLCDSWTYVFRTIIAAQTSIGREGNI